MKKTNLKSIIVLTLLLLSISSPMFFLNKVPIVKASPTSYNFTYLDHQDDGGEYRCVWGDSEYIYAACGKFLGWDAGLRAYTFDGSDFTLLDEQGPTDIIYMGVWGDGEYIYAACDSNGLRAYTFDGSNFNELANASDATRYYKVWGDGTYIYAACHNDGIYAYTFNGISFTLKATHYVSGGYFDVWGDGTYIYTACLDGGIRAYTFDGSDFSLLGHHDAGNWYESVWGDGEYIYAACYTAGVRAYSFDGVTNTFNLLDTQYDGGDIRYMDVWGDGTYIYTACRDGGIRAYRFNGTSFTEALDTDHEAGDGVPGYYLWVWGDGTYIYAACRLAGIFAYSFAGINNPPTITLNYPENGSTDISLEPSVICCIQANDIDGDNLDVTWATNESSSWVTKHTNTSVAANSTVSYTFTDFDSYYTKYYWKVYVNDGIYNVSKWFYFTTGNFTAEHGSGQLIPIGVAGWINMTDGSRASNAFVTVSNVYKGTSVTTTTNENGEYAVAIGGEDLDTIRVNCSHNGEAGSGTTNVDVSRVTHWVNLTLSLAAIPPVARFSYFPSYPREDEPVVFTDYSTDADGTIVEWLWDYGDGTTGLGKSARHTYKSEGFYDVKLKVTDNSELSDTARKTLQVFPVDPEDVVFIPPRQPPKYPLEPYTISEMYQVIRGDKLQMSHEEIIVVVIDTGVTPRLFNNTDLSDIKVLHHPSYDSGLDDNGHGTFVNAVVHYALEKWSPESTQYSIKALDENGVCLIDVFFEAMDMAKDLHPHIVTISAGAYGRPGDAFCRKVDELRNDGIIVTVAAGNSGPGPSTILSPACGRSSLAIGSIDPMKTILNRSDDMVSVWSSRGPVLNIFPRPSFTSPGESILGPWMYGEIIGSGTSFSTPFVAGGSMLIYANNKPVLDMVKTIYGIIGMKGLAVGIVEESIAEGCFDKGNRNSYGWGIVDIEKANEKVYMKCLIWIILFFGILTGIIIGIVTVIWHYKKPSKEKTAAKKPTGSTKFL